MELIKGCQPGPSIPLGTVRPGCLGLLGLQDRKHYDREDRLGGGRPLVAAVVWGTFVSPQAPVELSGALVIVLQALVFGSAAAGLAATGHRTLALVFVVVVVINAVLMYVWGQ